MPVRRLDPVLIDQIAAGEVVERPASAVKELVENALDAGATSIDITLASGGRTLIRVVDDGSGMDEADLELAVERHATSKLPEGDLMAIRSLGFRGEALPSIASVSRLAITTRAREAAHGLQLRVDAGVKSQVRPVAALWGTTIEVADLFYAIPARLKFLKSDRAEALAVADTVRRMAVVHPQVRFALSGDHLGGFVLPAEPAGPAGHLARLARVLGREFPDNAVTVEAERDGVRLTGHAGLPTYHRGQSGHVHLAVNGRPVRDRLLMSAVRGAYADVMSADRHPVLFLQIACDPAWVDVNVHPAKSEVRFRDPALVRSLVVSGLRAALAAAGHRASSLGGARTLAAFRGAMRPAYPSTLPLTGPSGWNGHGIASSVLPSVTPAHGGFGEAPAGGAARPASVGGDGFPVEPEPTTAGSVGRAGDPGGDNPWAGAGFVPSADQRAGAEPPSAAHLDRPLGAARAQLHETYIVAQTRDGVVIVDQHAAHERLVYERLKAERAAGTIARQMLLIPEVVELDPAAMDLLIDAADLLGELGLLVEPFGPGAVLVREVPARLAGCSVARMVRDLADALVEHGDVRALSQRLDAVLSTFACHHSIRAGRRLKPEEMDALLREMEATPLSGQCNHGRPTYVELKLGDIERLFGRR